MCDFKMHTNKSKKELDEIYRIIGKLILHKFREISDYIQNVIYGNQNRWWAMTSK